MLSKVNPGTLKSIVSKTFTDKPSDSLYNTSNFCILYLLIKLAMLSGTGILTSTVSISFSNHSKIVLV